MRTIASVAASSVALLLFASSVRAEPRARDDGRVAAVDDEPTSQRAALPPSGAASATKAPPSTGAGDGAPARAASSGMRGAIDDPGPLRDVTLPAPTARTVDGDAARPADHAVAAVPTRSDAPLQPEDALAELATRQLRKEARRHQRAVDACTAAAVKRHPAVTGTVTLEFLVRERRIADLHVSDDAVHDFALDACLTTVGKSFRFSLDAARFTWPVTLTPAAAL